ncbi:MAG TPA: MlaD family protein [Burkholderiales bacterium]|nr:MlaD family protein [Burkholderiales bacterium]
MTGEELPKARIRRRRLFRLVWVVPVIALAVAAYLVWQHMRSIGPEIAIRFGDASGLRVGQTPINYRGVQIGEVTRIELSDDHKQALVKARLHRSARAIATEGAVFWIVRPQIGLNQITGLSTVLSGPEIQVLPGKGETVQSEFRGLDNPPVGIDVAGLRIILRAERPKGIRIQTPINYRGVEVGTVQKIELAPNSASADIHILVRSRYAGLVRAGSAFWNASGVQASGGILKGLEVEIDSLRTLYTGSIEFATPSEKAPRVKPGTVFFLHDKPKDEWLNWSPKIALGGQEKPAAEKPAAEQPAAEKATPPKPQPSPDKASAN